METKIIILDLMKKENKPLTAKQISELSGLDKKEVDKGMKTLKAEGAISSPKACYWEAKK